MFPVHKSQGISEQDFKTDNNFLFHVLKPAAAKRIAGAHRAPERKKGEVLAFSKASPYKVSSN
jgi:hypothetical protein